MPKTRKKCKFKNTKCAIKTPATYIDVNLEPRLWTSQLGCAGIVYPSCLFPQVPLFLFKVGFEGTLSSGCVPVGGRLIICPIIKTWLIYWLANLFFFFCSTGGRWCSSFPRLNLLGWQKKTAAASLCHSAAEEIIKSPSGSPASLFYLDIYCHPENEHNTDDLVRAQLPWFVRPTRREIKTAWWYYNKIGTGGSLKWNRDVVIFVFHLMGWNLLYSFKKGKFLLLYKKEKKIISKLVILLREIGTMEATTAVNMGALVWPPS